MSEETRGRETMRRSTEASIAVLDQRLSHMEEQQRQLQSQLEKIEHSLNNLTQQVAEIKAALVNIRGQQEDHQRRLDEIHYPAKVWTGVLSHASSLIFGAAAGSIGTTILWHFFGK